MNSTSLIPYRTYKCIGWILTIMTGDFRVPESWKLYYKEGESWKEVEALTEYTVKKDCYNSLDFNPVKTKGLKIAAQLQKGASGGVIEWKVN